MWKRELPRSLGKIPVGLVTLVVITTSSLHDFKTFPSIFSEDPELMRSSSSP